VRRSNHDAFVCAIGKWRERATAPPPFASNSVATTAVSIRAPISMRRDICTPSLARKSSRVVMGAVVSVDFDAVNRVLQCLLHLALGALIDLGLIQLELPGH
jgi:hypothetical protein